MRHCFRCHSRTEDLDLERPVCRDDGIIGFLCVEEAACRSRALRRGLEDTPFCLGCGCALQVFFRGGRPRRCVPCEEHIAAGEHLQLVA